jgi:C4-dicarboxylate-specific signal transduction histidine kinase
MRMQQVLGDQAYAVLRPLIEQALHGEQVKFELLVPYSRLGPRRLCLRTQAHADRNVEVVVEDRGTGLHPQASRHLFEPFSTTKKNGMGLGLTVSRSIIKRHGGSLWATDNPCSGMTFHFTLPQP